MFVSCRWLLVGILGLLLAPGMAQAAPRTSTIDGIITAVDKSRKPVLVTIENETESVTLKVTASTQIGIPTPPNPPGVAAARAIEGLDQLQFGYAAQAIYVTATKVAKQIAVSGGPVLERGTGKVVAVNNSFGPLSIDITGDGVAELFLSTNADTRLNLGPAPISAEQLPLLLSQNVEFTYHVSSGRALEVTAVLSSVNSVEGEVTSVDVPGRALTLNTLSGPVSFTVAEGVDLRVLGRKVTLDTVVTGDTLRVTFATLADGAKVALAGAITGVRLKVVQGLLLSVDANAGTFTVKVGRGQLTLTVNAQTSIKLNGQVADLSALATVLAGGRPVLTSAEFLARRTENVATQVKAAGQTPRR